MKLSHRSAAARQRRDDRSAQSCAVLLCAPTCRSCGWRCCWQLHARDSDAHLLAPGWRDEGDAVCAGRARCGRRRVCAGGSGEHRLLLRVAVADDLRLQVAAAADGGRGDARHDLAVRALCATAAGGAAAGCRRTRARRVADARAGSGPGGPGGQHELRVSIRLPGQCACVHVRAGLAPALRRLLKRGFREMAPREEAPARACLHACATLVAHAGRQGAATRTRGSRSTGARPCAVHPPYPGGFPLRLSSAGVRAVLLSRVCCFPAVLCVREAGSGGVCRRVPP